MKGYGKDFKMKKNTFTKLIFLMFVASGLPANAQNSAKEGLERIKNNFNNSKANLLEYEKNLKIVDGNLEEVIKAKNQIQDQQKQVLNQENENSQALTRIEQQESDLQRLMGDEKVKTAEENLKIQELEALIAKIRDNQKKREMNISDYQLQLTQLQEEKKIWNSRANSLKEQGNQVAQKIKVLNNEEKEWRAKQKGYQGEVKRWSQEVDRQKKLNDSYESLAEVK